MKIITILTFVVFLMPLIADEMSQVPSEHTVSEKVPFSEITVIDNQLEVTESTYYTVILYFYEASSSTGTNWDGKLLVDIDIYDEVSKNVHIKQAKELNVDQGYQGETVLTFFSGDFDSLKDIRIKIEVRALDTNLEQKYSDIHLIIKELRGAFFD